MLEFGIGTVIGLVFCVLVVWAITPSAPDYTTSVFDRDPPDKDDE